MHQSTEGLVGRVRLLGRPRVLAVCPLLSFPPGSPGAVNRVSLDRET